MELRQLDNLTLKVTNADKDNEEPRSEILQNATPTGKYVTGAVLEATVQWDSWYLLFLTDDCPFEEALNTHLLDEHFDSIDSAVIGWIYNTGVFESLTLVQPNIVQFRFIGDITWRIELLQERAFRLPFFTEPRGVWRHWGFSRHFKVHGNPRP